MEPSRGTKTTTGPKRRAGIMRPRTSHPVALTCLLIVAAAIGVLVWIISTEADDQQSEIPLSELVQLAKQGSIRRITVQGDILVVDRYDDPVKTRARSDPDVDLYRLLREAGVADERLGRIEVAYQPTPFDDWANLVTPLLLVILLAGVLVFALRQAPGSSDRMLSLVKSRTRTVGEHEPATRFSDVAGIDEAKDELQDVVACLRHPERFAALGARIPRGVLLVGPPGTGKTLLARAVAGEAGVPFFNISGSEFVELFVGVGAARVRDLFRQARDRAPCIVFVDEIDAIGRRRGAGLGAGQDEREQTLNQILVEMDGFDPRADVVVLAATSRPDVLDSALLRPGRFDRQIVVDLPDLDGRQAILEVHTRGKPLAGTVDGRRLAGQTPGFSGADLANLVNEAAILAVRRNKDVIGPGEFEEAIDRVTAGPERKSRIISDKERLVTAYHEAGHAVVARALRHVDPVHKVSIVARGRMGGYTRLLPQEDRHLWSRPQLADTLCWVLGGHAAEEIAFGEITTGSEDDIERATTLARRMVSAYGMSERLGPVAMGRPEGPGILGRDGGEPGNVSAATAQAIDEEIRAFVGAARRRAREILDERRADLDRLAQRLFGEETIEGEELEKCFINRG